MENLISKFNTVAVASVADAVDKICGKRGVYGQLYQTSYQ